MPKLPRLPASAVIAALQRLGFERVRWGRLVCLGFAHDESHEGERPMAIRWLLEREIPAAWLPVMALAV